MRHKIGRWTAMYISAALIMVMIVAVAILLLLSPGKVRPVTGASGRLVPGSISEKSRVVINGTEQGMFIRSANPANPVLLIIHGGPGMPGYFLDELMPTGSEYDFTVVWWDQRGAGLSYNAGFSAPESITVDQLVDDTIAVTDYLRGRFSQPKIYLLAHSWGSYIGIPAARRAPDRYRAYIGMGKIVHQIESEKLAYDYALARCRDLGDTTTVRKLEASPVTTDGPLPAK